MNAIKIYDQIWASENLRTESFSNKEQILKASNIQEWIAFCDAKKPCCCSYDFKEANISKYGLIYNKYVITSGISIAPVGYRIATRNDWDVLIDGQGGINDCLPKIKSTKGWLKVGWEAMNGSNESGLNVTPGGHLYRGDLFEGPKFEDLKYGVQWWTDDGCVPHITHYDKKKFKFHDAQPTFRDNADKKPEKSGRYIRLIASVK